MIASGPRKGSRADIFPHGTSFENTEIGGWKLPPPRNIICKSLCCTSQGRGTHITCAVGLERSEISLRCLFRQPRMSAQRCKATPGWPGTHICLSGRSQPLANVIATVVLGLPNQNDLIARVDCHPA